LLGCQGMAENVMPSSWWVTLERPDVAKPTWLRRLLEATLVFNLVDAIVTLWVVSSGIATEANPLMARALERGPVAFAICKLGVVSLGVLVLWRERARRLAVVGAVAVFAVYLLVMAYHVQSIRIALGAS
jgi:hypothetical protein